VTVTGPQSSKRVGSSESARLHVILETEPEPDSAFFSMLPVY
jgi:hypothetical protein